MVRSAVGQVPWICFWRPRECQSALETRGEVRVPGTGLGVGDGVECWRLPNSRRRFLRRMQAKYSLPSTVSCQSGTITEPCMGGLAMVEHASEVKDVSKYWREGQPLSQGDPVALNLSLALFWNLDPHLEGPFP